MMTLCEGRFPGHSFFFPLPLRFKHSCRGAVAALGLKASKINPLYLLHLCRGAAANSFVKSKGWIAANISKSRTCNSTRGGPPPGPGAKGVGPRWSEWRVGSTVEQQRHGFGGDLEKRGNMGPSRG